MSSDFSCFQRNHLLCVRERICSSHNYFSDIKKSLHGFQKSDSTGNWSSLPAITEKYPHPSEHKNKERKKRGIEREREERRLRNEYGYLYEGPRCLQRQFSRRWAFWQEVFPEIGKEDKMSSSVPLQPEHNVWCHIKCSLDNNEHASVNCTSEVRRILAQNQLSKYAYGFQGMTNRIYRIH